MPLPRGYRWHHDDKVRLTGTIKHDYRDNAEAVFIKIDGHYDTVLMDPAEIELISQHVKIDDHVKCLEDGVTGVVIAVHDDFAWVKPDILDIPFSARLTNLVRVETETEIAEAV